MTQARTSVATFDGSDAGAWLGIRYGVADRWQAPRPVGPVDGLQPAKWFGPSAPQQPGPMSGAVPGMAVTDTAEDCLTLNVWAPHAADGLPVMVWIHGGAFQIGGTSLQTYDGSTLSREQQVVVVSLNYRLGALGWLTGVDGVVPNCGLLDLQLGLQWVRDHIAAFGGDPANVTVFGESAGAGAVLHLMASSTGLFDRAIAMSPGAGQTLPSELGRQVADALLAKVPLDAPVEDILAAQAEVSAELLPLVGAMPFHPSGEPLWGRTGDVPLLIGTTSQEMSLFVPPMELDADTLTSLLEPLLSAEAHRPLGADAVNRVVKAYSGPTAMADIATDVTMRLPVERLLDAHPGPAYAYQFTYETTHGACHAADLPFVFNSFDVEGWRDWVGGSPDGLGRTIRDAWAAFARTGVPRDDWPPYDERRLMMELGPEVTVVADPLAEARSRCAPVL
ncbi:MAG: Carboxylesterase [Frankiales bacterium]|nr:Carboxylesterase [Frankiales bacterium]